MRLKLKDLLNEVKIILFKDNGEEVKLNSKKIKTYNKSKNGKYKVGNLVKFKYADAIVHGKILGFFVYDGEEYFYEDNLTGLGIETKTIMKKLNEGRMNISGVKNIVKTLGQASADSTYFAMNKLGYKGYPNSPDDPRIIDFMITTRMYDGSIKIIMKDTMAKDPKVQAELRRLKK